MESVRTMVLNAKTALSPGTRIDCSEEGTDKDLADFTAASLNTLELEGRE
jgi:hypothetical protein